MTFLALTGSPVLEAGVTLNVMATPQASGAEPMALHRGETVRIRLGHCCPQMAEAMITEADDDHVVLALGETCLTLKRGPAGSGVPIVGIVSDDWVVC